MPEAPKPAAPRPFGSSIVVVAPAAARPAVTSAVILTYSQSTNPTSPFFADQTRMFSKKQWVDVPFCRKDVLAATLSTLRLGGSRCLAKRAKVGRGGVGRVRLGLTRKRLLRSPRLAGVAPVSKRRTRYRYCVKRSRGRVSAVFGRRGRVELVTTTAKGHGNGRVRPGNRARRLRVYPRRRRIAPGLYRVAPRSARIVSVRKGRVRLVGVASKRLLRTGNRRVLRRYLRRAAS